MITPDETLREAARLLRGGCPVDVLVGGLDDAAAKALHSCVMRRIGCQDCGHPWGEHCAASYTGAPDGKRVGCLVKSGEGGDFCSCHASPSDGCAHEDPVFSGASPCVPLKVPS